MAHFSYKSILCYLVSSLCSVVRKFFCTDKRSGGRVDEGEEKNKNVLGVYSTPEATTQYIQYGEYHKTTEELYFWNKVECFLTENPVPPIAKKWVKNQYKPFSFPQ